MTTYRKIAKAWENFELNRYLDRIDREEAEEEMEDYEDEYED